MDILNITIGFPVLCFQAILVLLGTILWRRYSSLRDVPGPFLASITRLWHAKQIKDGTQKMATIQLHDELGPFVRIAPDEVSVAHPDALRKLLLTPQKKVCQQTNITVPAAAKPLLN